MTPSVTATTVPAKPVIGVILAQPNPVGYGKCNGKLPDTLTIQVMVSSGATLSYVTLAYLYVSANPQVPPGPYHKVAMSPSTGATYGALVYVGQEAGTDLHGTSGTLEYQVLAGDAAGGTARSDVGKVQVQYCTG